MGIKTAAPWNYFNFVRRGYALVVQDVRGRSVSEGDFLRRILELGTVENAVMEAVRIDDIVDADRHPPVRITATMEDLLYRAQEQNFVPVIDDRGAFMGIVTRHDILQYFTDHMHAQKGGDGVAER